jgi:hypothetical protein
VLTPQQVAELLSARPPFDPEVAGRTLADAYLLDQDQSLLVFDNGTGRLYESRAAMLAAMDAIANQRRAPQ